MISMAWWKVFLSILAKKSTDEQDRPDRAAGVLPCANNVRFPDLTLDFGLTNIFYMLYFNNEEKVRCGQASAPIH